MIRFGVEISDIVQAIEGLRKNASDLLYAVNQKDSELAHVNFMFLKIALSKLDEQVKILTREYDLAIAEEARKRDV
jgi:hypothetical protein